MMTKFVIGDVHGGYLSLLQVLERSHFDKENDELIVLGDVCDGWPQTLEVIEELLTIKNLIPLFGNHDYWLYEWIIYGRRPNEWVTQGGQATIDSYKYNGLIERAEVEVNELLNRHKLLYFNKCKMYYLDENNNAYVHGGYTSNLGILGKDFSDVYMWDRSLWSKAKSSKNNGLNLTKIYNRVFIGHTSIGNGLPQKAANVWNLDTGGGFEGKLTMMNVDTEEFYQSDKVELLYSKLSTRNKKKQRVNYYSLESFSWFD